MKIFAKILWPLVAVLAAFVVGGIIVLIIGDNPVRPLTAAARQFVRLAKGHRLDAALRDAADIYGPGGGGRVPVRAVEYRCGRTALCRGVRDGVGRNQVRRDGRQYFWQGGELVVDEPAVRIVLVPLCILTAIVAGGIWGAIPGYLKAKFGSHEVINTIMLNFIGIALVSYFTQYYYKVPGDAIMQTAEIGEAADIPRLNQFMPFIPKDVPLSVAFLLAILMCFLVYVFLWKTKWGYELRAVGENPSAAEYGGI